jgi:hypothetical protein
LVPQAQNSTLPTTIPNSVLTPPNVGEGDLSDEALSNRLRDMDEALTALENRAKDKPWWSTHNAMTISAVILAFGAAIIALASLTTKTETSLEEKLRLYGTVMVITMAGFLVVAGYNDTQIAAPLGLLGTIAGYLLGKEVPKREGVETVAPGRPDAEG